jgi:hypothetical protein
MSLSKLERMIKLADEVFYSRQDNEQIIFDDSVEKKLNKIHPECLSEFDDNGPVAWILIIPTTIELMDLFLKNSITEKQLLALTPLEVKYDALYLCSALVLEEYRRKGIAEKTTISSIQKVIESYPIKYLFVWPFSISGENLAKKIASICELPLKLKHHS